MTQQKKEELMLWEMNDLVAAHGGTDGVRRFLASKEMLPASAASSTITTAATATPVKHFTVLTDGEVRADLRPVLAKWRHWAQEFSYNGPIVYRVQAGYTLKHHAPKHGPCFQHFQYLQDWHFNDEPTKDSTVFWIPRIVPGSFSKTFDDQLKLLADTRDRLELPKHHLTSLGSVALMSGLILTHCERTGERVPLDLNYVRTSSRSPGGRRLGLGGFAESGLGCGHWWRDGRHGRLGVFGLGVELGH